MANSMNVFVRNAINTFDARYAMYIDIFDGDTWNALAAALLARLPSSFNASNV